MKKALLSEVLGLLPIPRRTTLPALSNIKVGRDSDNNLTIYGTNLDVWVSVSFFDRMAGEKDHLISYQAVKDALKVCGKDIDIDLDRADGMAIASNGKAIPIANSDFSDWPEWMDIGDCHEVMFISGGASTANFLDRFLALEGMVAEEDYRPSLNRVRVDTEAKRMVATDGHKLALLDLTKYTAIPDSNIKSFNLFNILNLIGKVKNPTDFRLEHGEKANLITMQTDDYEVKFITIVDSASKDKDGTETYPPYERVIPTARERSFAISYDDIVMLAKMYDLVRLTFKKDGTVSYSWADKPVINSTYMGINIDYCDWINGKAAETFSIGYNAKFLKEVASVFHKPGDMVVCYYENRERAMLIEHEETEISLLMPVRLPNVPE